MKVSNRQAHGQGQCTHGKQLTTQCCLFQESRMAQQGARRKRTMRARKGGGTPPTSRRAKKKDVAAKKSKSTGDRAETAANKQHTAAPKKSSLKLTQSQELKQKQRLRELDLESLSSSEGKVEMSAYLPTQEKGRMGALGFNATSAVQSKKQKSNPETQQLFETRRRNSCE
jgi:hypothetical protein